MKGSVTLTLHRNGPTQEILLHILITSVSSEGSNEPVHMSLCTSPELSLLAYYKYRSRRFRQKIIEDIYFFEVTTKYISSSVLKTSEFSGVRITSGNFDVFNSRDEIYLVFY